MKKREDMELVISSKLGIDPLTADRVRLEPKVCLQVEFGSYVLKTAETARELLDCLRLRAEVFFEEFQGKSNVGLDVDRFDGIFDHLIIYHRERQELVGTYRVNCSQFSKESYTALEFTIDCVMQREGPHLELGRACIRKEYRKGAVIALLWRGLAEYMKLTKSKLLFGCSSVKVMDVDSAAKFMVYMEKIGAVDHSLVTRPTVKYRMQEFIDAVQKARADFSEEDQKLAEALMPPLLKSYLRNGAKVAMEPALDVEFKCIDVFTVLEVGALRESVVAKYQIDK